MPFSSRKIAEGIYGGHLPRDVAAAVALGILTGAITGGNLSWAAMLLAAILFNVHTRLFLAAWLASMLLAWFARGCVEDLGRFLLDRTPLAGDIGELGDGALVALLGWDQYALVGGLACGVVLAVAGAWLAFRFTQRHNDRWSDDGATTDAAEVHEPTDEPPRCDGAIIRVWFGPTVRERSLRRTMAPRRLRRCGVPAAMAAALTLAIAPWWLAGRRAERELFRQLSVYNGAEVSSGGRQLSLWSGDFVVHDLQIADPQHLDRDRLHVGLAKGKLSSGLLLRGHLDIEKLVLAQVRVDVARRRTARANDALVRPALPSVGNSSLAGDLEINSVPRSWKTACRSLASLRQLVAVVEQLSRVEDAGELSAGARSQLGVRRPWIVVRQMRVSNFATGLDLGRKPLIELTDLSSNPALSKRPTQLKVVLPKFGAEVQLELALNNPGQPHTVRCSACDVDLAQLIDSTEAGSVLSLEQGRARLSGEGSFDRQRLDVRLLVEAESLSAEVAGNRPLLGIDPALWKNGLNRLGAFHAEVALSGHWFSPSIVIDSDRLVEQFKQQLRAAGELGIVAAVEQQHARYEEAQADSAVMQAAATEPQMSASRPGLCEFSEDGPPGPAPSAEYDAPAGADVEAQHEALQYPTTSVPYDDSSYDPPPISPPPIEAAAARQRRLPGPVNMVVGRDPYAGLSSSPDPAAAISHALPRESLLSRWTQGLRQKLGQAFSKPESAMDEPTEPADHVLNPRDERSIPAAASEAWYNRRWR